MTNIEIRDKVKEEIKRTFIGPLTDNDEILDFNPLRLYTSGILYPQDASYGQIKIDDSASNGISYDGADGSNEKSLYGVVQDDKMGRGKLEQLEEDTKTEELTLASSFKPSAMGISFIVNAGSKFTSEISFAKYYKIENEKEEKKDNKNIKSQELKYQCKAGSVKIVFVIDTDTTYYTQNEELKKQDPGNYFKIPVHGSNTATTLVLAVTKRKYFDDGRFIITLTLINTHVKEELNYESGADDHNEVKKTKSTFDINQCYFRNAIRVISESNNPVFLPYDDLTQMDTLGAEEINLKLLYRNYKTYASGHGCSASWNDLDISNAAAKDEICTESIPEYKVSGNDYEPNELTGISNILCMKKLCGEAFYANDEERLSKTEMLNQLGLFAEKYNDWINEQRTKMPSLTHDLLKEQAEKNMLICDLFYQRMLKGIRVLSENENALGAFYDANKAMFMQRAMAGFIRERKNRLGDDLYPGDNVNERLPVWRDYSFNGNDYFKAKWRPFQLAFLLSQINGIVEPQSDDRDTVDLLWFATGGGKTEAYLGLTAFTIFYRRLREDDPDNGAGVSVMMRYTLRLLNMQQFQRASSLICACELIRRDNHNRYGMKQISLGIWVGRITPNKWKGSDKNPQFHESYLQLYGNPSFDSKFHFPIFSCPCCGTKIIKTGAGKNQNGEWGIIRDKVNYYGLKCTNTNCDFHVESTSEFSKKLPIHFVDEDIYDIQPSLLFSTIDKYAAINWNTDSYKLFNYDLSLKQYTNPPPELIIQDELHLINSTLGTIYGVYEIAIDELCSGQLIMPKIIAATATVRNAEEQCRQLYARKHFMQFPPAGIDADDSFYSRKKKNDDAARLYLGLQPSGHTNTDAQIRLVSMLMQRIPMLKACNDVMDNYYTSLIYFNTLKELGKFRTLLVDDIDDYREFLASRIYQGNYDSHDESKIAELSSFRSGKEITAYLEQIDKLKLDSHLNCDDAMPLFRLGLRLRRNIDFENPTFHSTYFPKLYNKRELFKKLNIDFDENDIDNNKAKFIKKVKAIFGNSEPDVLKIVAATNMVSVGVDISRLNIMQITGQPKSHSEYIQASSRVGRSVPGLIITTFNPAKNRDRSHYEKFIDYHQAFYKDVESTTVTPFSKPALEKALSAVLIALMQSFHYGISQPIFENTDRAFYDKLVEKIKLRAGKAILKTDLANLAINNISRIADEIKRTWSDQYTNLQQNITFSKSTHYVYQGRLNNPDPNKIGNALYINPAFSNLWPHKLKCMTSLRNIEFHSLIDIKNY